MKDVSYVCPSHRIPFSKSLFLFSHLLFNSQAIGRLEIYRWSCKGPKGRSCAVVLLRSGGLCTKSRPSITYRVQKSTVSPRFPFSFTTKVSLSRMRVQKGATWAESNRAKREGGRVLDRACSSLLLAPGKLLDKVKVRERERDRRLMYRLVERRIYCRVPCGVNMMDLLKLPSSSILDPREKAAGEQIGTDR